MRCQQPTNNPHHEQRTNTRDAPTQHFESPRAVPTRTARFGINAPESDGASLVITGFLCGTPPGAGIRHVNGKRAGSADCAHPYLCGARKHRTCDGRAGAGQAAQKCPSATADMQAHRNELSSSGARRDGVCGSLNVVMSSSLVGTTQKIDVMPLHATAATAANENEQASRISTATAVLQATRAIVRSFMHTVSRTQTKASQ